MTQHEIQGLFVVGSLFQAAGVTTVFFQVLKAERLFNRRDWSLGLMKTITSPIVAGVRRAYRLVRELWLKKRPRRAVSGTATSFGNVDVTLGPIRDQARAVVTRADDDNARLWTAINDLHLSLATLKQEQDTQRRAFVNELEVVNQSLETAQSKLTTKLQEVAIGSLPWQVAGAICILLGIVMICAASIQSVPHAIP